MRSLYTTVRRIKIPIGKSGQFVAFKLCWSVDLVRAWLPHQLCNTAEYRAVMGKGIDLHIPPSATGRRPAGVRGGGWCHGFLQPACVQPKRIRWTAENACHLLNGSYFLSFISHHSSVYVLCKKKILIPSSSSSESFFYMQFVRLKVGHWRTSSTGHHWLKHY